MLNEASINWQQPLGFSFNHETRKRKYLIYKLRRHNRTSISNRICQGGISGRPKYPNKRHYRLVRRRGVGTRRANYRSWGVAPQLTHILLHPQGKDDDGPTHSERAMLQTYPNTNVGSFIGLDSHADRPTAACVFTWHANNARQNNTRRRRKRRKGQVSVRSKGSKGIPQTTAVCVERLLLPTTLASFVFFVERADGSGGR